MVCVCMFMYVCIYIYVKEEDNRYMGLSKKKYPRLQSLGKLLT